MPWALAFVLAMGATRLSAQAPPEPEVSAERLEEARTHHLAGVAALQAGDLDVAEREFSAALAITFRGSTGYNLALVLTEKGRVGEALALYDRVLALPDDALPREREGILFDRERATVLRANIEVIVSGAESAEVRLDGETVGTVRAGFTLAIPVDAGEHVVEANADDRHLSMTVTLGASETQVARLAFLTPELVISEPVDEPTVEAADPTIIPPAGVQARRRRRRLAGGLVGAAVVVAAVVALSIVFSGGPSDEGINEPPFGRFDALRTP